MMLRRYLLLLTFSRGRARGLIGDYFSNLAYRRGGPGLVWRVAQTMLEFR
jgi:hypothetical protein